MPEIQNLKREYDLDEGKKLDQSGKKTEKDFLSIIEESIWSKFEV